MYARAYNSDTQGIVIPDSYGGTALYEPTERMEEQEATVAEASKNPWEDEVHTESETVASREPKSSFFSKLPFLDFLPNIFKTDTFGLQKIGLEEILILATAAFLLFSRDGDKECAILLIALLFLK